MLFSSLTFLFYFLPATLLLYYILPNIARNYVLLALSILFYAWGGIDHTFLLLGSVLINFLLAKKVGSEDINAKKWLIAGMIFNVALLVVFKYTGFLTKNIGMLAGISEEDALVKIILPLGISFYTFHQMSMLRDIYRDKALPRVTLANTALYVTFFPQLVAGPIVRYKDIIYQIRDRKVIAEQIFQGIQRFIIGLFKKVVIANACALVADAVIGKEITDLTSGAAWLGILAYTLQIYYDFSGYSDMAIGLAKMFGFDLLENFNLPYAAKSIKDFWRRWHISLSTWFRDYVYIPLGGNKKGNIRTYVNLFIVFALTGFWHGASWSFMFWGIFHGFFLILERVGLDKILDKLPGIIGWGYTMLIVMTGWIFFRIEDFGDATNYFAKLWDFGSESMYSVYYFLDNESITLILAGIIFSMLPFKRITERIQSNIPIISLLIETCRSLVYILMFLYSVMVLTSSTYNPFIYFNF